MSTPRLVYTSVTNFLRCGNEYLLLHRRADKRIDPNRLNGIGGKLELGENYLDAAIRETEEETGYVVKPEQIHLNGVMKLVGGYTEDWVVCFFTIDVPNKKIPKGNITEDGELMWLPKDQVLTSPYEMVDDLNIVFPKVIEGKELFFMTAQVNEQEKIASYTLTSLP